MHPLPLPATLASPHSAQAALDKAIAALEWVMQQRPDRPTSIESVRRAATTVLNLATKLLAPPSRPNPADHAAASALLASPIHLSHPQHRQSTIPLDQAFPPRLPLNSQISDPTSPPPARSHGPPFSTPSPPPALILAAYNQPPRAQSLKERAGAAPPRRPGPPSIIAPDSG